MNRSTHVRMAAAEETLLARWPETRIEPSLERIRALLSRLGDPHRAVSGIHVTGTNGKTTTARIIDELLRVNGRRTGRYTSPHLESIRERIVVDGATVHETTFLEAFDVVRPAAESVESDTDATLSFFEFMTAVAFVVFQRSGVDSAIIEVGMGGTWDATNVFDGRVAAITPISLDHVQYLGPDIESIATEKAGIIKPGATVVSAAQPPAADRILAERARSVGASIRRARRSDLAVKSVPGRPPGQLLQVDLGGQKYHDVFLPLLGRHQAENAHVALSAVDAYLQVEGERLDRAQAGLGLARVRAPGRLEMLRMDPPILVDASHNPEGMAATVRALCGVLALLGVERIVVVLAVLGDKDVDGMVRALDPVASAVVVTRNGSPRALSADDLAAVAMPLLSAGRVISSPTLPGAIRTAARLADDPYDRAAVLVTGSVVTAGEARRLLAKGGAAVDTR